MYRHHAANIKENTSQSAHVDTATWQNTCGMSNVAQQEHMFYSGTLKLWWSHLSRTNHKQPFRVPVHPGQLGQQSTWPSRHSPATPSLPFSSSPWSETMVRLIGNNNHEPLSKNWQDAFDIITTYLHCTIMKTTDRQCLEHVNSLVGGEVVTVLKQAAMSNTVNDMKQRGATADTVNSHRIVLVIIDHIFTVKTVFSRLTLHMST